MSRLDLFPASSPAPLFRGVVGVIGGGLVGMATAWRLQTMSPGARVVLWEKESEVGQHQSTHNSGVLHAGLYYKPGSLKARLAVQGIRQMVAFCREHAVPHDICGKVVVATNDEEVGRLKVLIDRGTQNGLVRLRWLSRSELREIEPHASGLAAVHVPEEGIVNYSAVCRALYGQLARVGVQVVTSAQVSRLSAESGQWRVETRRGDWLVDFLVNCAGLHCDRVANAAGAPEVPRILPFRGEYYQLKSAATRLVNNLIYPVPDPAFPFLGVHFTRLIGGGVEAGPNAVLALAREGYRWDQINPSDVVDALSYPGLWRFMFRHFRMAGAEIMRSLSRQRFCEALQKLVPAIQESDLEPGGAGVRAQAVLPDGRLVQDFHFIRDRRALHVLNAPSPAATASLAIGEHIAREVLSQC